MTGRWSLLARDIDLGACVYKILESDGIALYSRPEQCPQAWIATCDTLREAREAARQYIDELRS